MRITDNSENYYAGGLAEIVSSPSELTISFFTRWVKTNDALGKSLELLDLPYVKSDQPILVVDDVGFLVDLKAEENSLYRKTILAYDSQIDINQIPKLKVQFSKIFKLENLINTSRLIKTQSNWIARPQKILDLANQLLDQIPQPSSRLTIKEIDNILSEAVWPTVLSIGMLSEFYYSLIKKSTEAQNYISHYRSQNDWIVKSYTDRYLVKTKKMSFSNYIKAYGLRSDNDYELTQPRWYEIPKKILTQINDSKPPLNQPQKFNPNNLTKISAEFQILRSEAKRKTLPWIDLLRKAIYRLEPKTKNTANLTREKLLTSSADKPKKITHVKTKISLHNRQILSGSGFPVSKGVTSGNVLHLKHKVKTIPKDTIGIFPNASPEFAIYYPKCAGMIFLKGGATSHGAIVAREYGIPAIVDPKAVSLQNKEKVTLNANTGSWSKFKA